MALKCGLNSTPSWFPKCIEFVGRSRLVPSLFLRVLRFSFLVKDHHFKFRFKLDAGGMKTRKD